MTIDNMNATHRAYLQVTHYCPNADAIVTTREAYLARIEEDESGQIGTFELRRFNVAANDVLRLTKYMIEDITGISARYIAAHEGYLKAR